MFFKKKQRCSTYWVICQAWPKQPLLYSPTPNESRFREGFLALMLVLVYYVGNSEQKKRPLEYIEIWGCYSGKSYFTWCCRGTPILGSLHMLKWITWRYMKLIEIVRSRFPLTIFIFNQKTMVFKSREFYLQCNCKPLTVSFMTWFVPAQLAALTPEILLSRLTKYLPTCLLGCVR